MMRRLRDWLLGAVDPDLPPPPPPLDADDDWHVHRWEPVSIQSHPVYGTTAMQEYIYALCPCGEARKFAVGS